MELKAWPTQVWGAAGAGISHFLWSLFYVGFTFKMHFSVKMQCSRGEFRHLGGQPGVGGDF